MKRITNKTAEVLEGVLKWLSPIVYHSTINAPSVEEMESQKKLYDNLNIAMSELNPPKKP